MSAVANEKDVELSALVAQWMEAKLKEIQAVDDRRKIDVQIVALMPQKDEGSVSKDVGFFKVGVTYGINRKVDSGQLDIEWDKLPPAVQAAFRWKAEVSTREYKALSGADLDAAVAFVESKPASPNVKVEVIDPAKM